MLMRTVLFLTILWLATAAVAAGDDPRVLLLGLDGVRPEALAVADTPVIDDLIANGCYTDEALTGDITVSGPGWSSILTGVWRDKHNVHGNDFRRPAYDVYPHFFDRLKEKRPDAWTAAIFDWQPLEFLLGPTTADFSFFHPYDDGGDVLMVEHAVKVLAEHDPDALFVYIADIDVVGHAFGFHPDVPEYIAKIEEVDRQVGTILAAMRGRPTYADEDWLVLVTTDHGGTIDGNHGRDEPTHRKIFYIASGDAAGRGTIHGTVNQVDAPVTALAHLGVEIDPAWQLDGRPIGLKADTGPDRETPFGVNLIFNGDAEYAGGYNAIEPNAGIAGWHDTGSMTVVAYGAPEGFPGPGDSGAEEGGGFFFCGGKDGWSSITQTIEVASLDQGWYRFEASGLFGGFADQRDIAKMRIEFLGDRGGVMGRAAVGGVTNIQRNSATGLLRRAINGPVPAGTSRIRVTLECEAGTGDNDGYADNLALVIYWPEDDPVLKLLEGELREGLALGPSAEVSVDVEHGEGAHAAARVFDIGVWFRTLEVKAWGLPRAEPVTFAELAGWRDALHARAMSIATEIIRRDGSDPHFNPDTDLRMTLDCWPANAGWDAEPMPEENAWFSADYCGGRSLGGFLKIGDEERDVEREPVDPTNLGLAVTIVPDSLEWDERETITGVLCFHNQSAKRIPVSSWSDVSIVDAAGDRPEVHRRLWGEPVWEHWFFMPGEIRAIPWTIATDSLPWEAWHWTVPPGEYWLTFQDFGDVPVEAERVKISVRPERE